MAFIFLFALSQFGTDWPGTSYVFVFHQVHPQETVCLTLPSLLYDSNCFRMFFNFGISTTVFYIFILVSYFRMRSEHALLNIP